MNFSRNIHFTLLIRINKRLREFNFRKRNPQLYDVDTSDEQGNRHFFKLEFEGETWKIGASANIPAWIKENELILHEEIFPERSHPIVQEREGC